MLQHQDALDRLKSIQLDRIRRFLKPNAVVDIRMCRTSGGQDGRAAAQKLADALSRRILGYAGPVSYYGGPALYTKRDKDNPMPYFKHFFQDPEPCIFYPTLDSSR